MGGLDREGGLERWLEAERERERERGWRVGERWWEVKGT